METRTSSFPSNRRSQNRAQLDNIIFYSGPSSAKTREITLIDADEGPEIDMIFAEAAQEEWAAGTERLDPVDGFDTPGEDIRNAIGTSSAAQAATSTAAHLEDVSTLLGNPFDHSRGGVADRGGSIIAQEPLDVWATQIHSVPAGTLGAVPLDVQHNGGDIGIAAQDCPLHDSASLALWEAFRGEVSISAPATDGPTSPPRTPKPDGSNLPLHTPQLPPGGPDINMALSNKPPLEEGDRVQQSPLIAGHEHNSASPTVLESYPVEQEDTSKAACNISANAALSEGSTCDRAHSSHGADITDAADTEGSNSDGPLTRRRRRWTRPRTCDSNSSSLPLTPRLSAHSVDVESTTALRRRKRLRRRKGMQPNSPTPEIDGTCTTLTPSMLSRGGDRSAVQCFDERKIIGSQEVIMIELPALEFCARPGPVLTLSPSDDTSQTPPSWCAARKSGKSRRRCRFTRKEEDLLAQLKEQREPKLSWREIQRHFPNRSIGSLQVHYSTQLKVQRPWGRAAAKKM